MPQVPGREAAPPPMPKHSDAAPKTFESALAELESIVATMEAGQLPLADSLAAYKRGAELLQYCQAALKDAQQQVRILENGVLKAFAPERADAEAGDEP
jgi:exodeoxyribonuclease VII small subunit